MYESHRKYICTAQYQNLKCIMLKLSAKYLWKNKHGTFFKLNYASPKWMCNVLIEQYNLRFTFSLSKFCVSSLKCFPPIHKVHDNEEWNKAKRTDPVCYNFVLLIFLGVNLKASLGYGALAII